MKHLRLSVVIATAAIVLFTISCGSSSKHEIVALNVTPASVTSTAPVEFTATGQYRTSPYTEVPAQINWGACFQGAPTSAVAVTSTGTAQCNQGVTGTYTIWATSPVEGFRVVCPAVVEPCGSTCGNVRGTAQLTCAAE